MKTKTLRKMCRNGGKESEKCARIRIQTASKKRLVDRFNLLHAPRGCCRRQYFVVTARIRYDPCRMDIKSDYNGSPDFIMSCQFSSNSVKRDSFLSTRNFQRYVIVSGSTPFFCISSITSFKRNVSFYLLTIMPVILLFFDGSNTDSPKSGYKSLSFSCSLLVPFAFEFWKACRSLDLECSI